MNYKEVLAQIEEYDHFIVDEVIMQLYPEISEAIKDKNTYVVFNPEESKNFHDYQKIVDHFIDKKITRHDQIVAIGGGALSDLAGFVAATLLRGIDWVIFPTTLLAMIDASIGGKVGINLKQGKNLVGAFHKPKEILVCPHFLSTLPDLELTSGQGELLKYLFLSRDIFSKAQSETDFQNLIQICADYKNEIITLDPFEKGVRAYLNLGHTFGHAIEKLIHMPHGVCVYYGLKMIFAFFNEPNYKVLEEFVSKFKLEFPELGKLNIDDIFCYLEQDKKRKNPQEVDLILVDEIGSPYAKGFDIKNLKSIIMGHKNYENFFRK